MPRLVVLGACLWTQLASADTRDPAAAQALFDDAKKLIDARRYAEACPKLAESQKLDPAGGTTLVLAMCYEGEGKLASAWAAYTQAVSEARRDKRPDREKAAADKISALTPRLSRLRISPAGGGEPDLTVKRNGAPVGRAQWATAVPMDPGEYAFEASAPGKKVWRGTARIVGEGSLFDIMIPALEAEPEAPASAAPARGAAPSPPVAPEREAQSSSRWWASGITAGVGVIALGAGTVVGLGASSDWAALKDRCPGGRCPNASLVSDGAGIGTRADIATGLAVAGGAAVVGGVLLFALWPDEPRRAAFRPVPILSPGSAGLSLGGAM